MYKIAVIPGDGTGPEVINEGLKVLEQAGKMFGFKYETKFFDFSGQRYLKTGKLVDDSDVEELKKYNAIYLGAVGDPEVKPGIIETGVLLKLRFALDQYINLRPVKLYNSAYCPLKDKQPEDIDFVVVRENSEGLYKGMGEFKDKGTKEEVAIQISYNTRKGVER
ncbi:MAG: isocitrate/isopropylmalate family dehydrogenase, partial [Candidatus Omnitrophota bacterium]